MRIKFYFGFWRGTRANTSRNVSIPKRYSNTELTFFSRSTGVLLRPILFVLSCMKQKKEPVKKTETIQYASWNIPTAAECYCDFTFLNMIFFFKRCPKRKRAKIKPSFTMLEKITCYPHFESAFYEFLIIFQVCLIL